MKRILIHEKPTTLEISFFEKLKNYLSPIFTLYHGEMPTITVCYRDAFNYINKINQMLGQISNLYMVKSKKLIWFIYTFSITTAMNAYSHWMDLNCNYSRVGNELSL